MGRRSREKGKRGEREAVGVLRRLFSLPARRTAQVDGGLSADIVVGRAVHIEVKRRAAIGAMRFLEQAENAAGEGNLPLVLLREDGDKSWSVLVRLENLAGVVRELERPERPTTSP